MSLVFWKPLIFLYFCQFSVKHAITSVMQILLALFRLGCPKSAGASFQLQSPSLAKPDVCPIDSTGRLRTGACPACELSILGRPHPDHGKMGQLCFSHRWSMHGPSVLVRGMCATPCSLPSGAARTEWHARAVSVTLVGRGVRPVATLVEETPSRFCETCSSLPRWKNRGQFCW